MTERKRDRSRELSRRIKGAMVKQWAVFTAVFLMMLFLLSGTLFPRLGDWIADHTTEWRVLYPTDYPLKNVFDGMGFRNDDGTYDLTSLGKIEDASGMVDYGMVVDSAMSLDFDLASKYGELYNLVDALEEGREYRYTVDGTPGSEEYIVVTRDTSAYASGSIAIDDAGATYLYASFGDMLDSPFFGFMSMEEAEYALRMRALMDSIEDRVRDVGLRNRYMENLVLGQVPLSRDSSDWQMIWGEDGSLAYRDLSVYDFLRQLKTPFILALYFVGCGVIVLLALRRSLRSFDRLAGAVGGIIADREKPVELPDDLATVQDELNSMRLAALADERAAVAAERRKDELVAYLAHDVRTPLTSVIGYLSLLDEAPDLPEEPRKKYTRIAFDKACRLEGLIDEFFEITRYNLQAIPIERAWVSVRLFCEQVAEGFYVEAEARRLSIEVDAPSDARFFVDADKLARAVGNVVRNAIAYADPDTTIRLCAVAAEGEESPVWEIRVTDRGREISQAHLKSIFDKFYREDGARGTEEGGTGLGLAIAQEIVVAHKGNISAESEDGTTTFTITLPRLDDPLTAESVLL